MNGSYEPKLAEPGPLYACTFITCQGSRGLVQDCRLAMGLNHYIGAASSCALHLSPDLAHC